MTKITGITSSPLQTFNIYEPVTGEKIYFKFYFRPRTQNWYMDVTYKTFTEKGVKIVRGSNIFYRHKNTVPFGIAVSCTDSFEPYIINDFVSGRVSMYLLTADEVTQFEDLTNSGDLTS